MYRISKIFRTIGWLPVYAMFVSCYHEEMPSNCPKDIRVYFTFSSNTINTAEVDRMHLYFFNQDGLFVGECRDDHIVRFSSDYYLDYSGLKPGNYRFIAWGGKDDRFYNTTPAPFVVGQTTFHEALLLLSHPENILSTHVHPIFHSDINTTVTYENKQQRFTMPLNQLSNTISISTVGLPMNEDAYTFNIKDNNCVYKFDGSFAPHSHPTITYEAPCTKDEAGQLHSSLRVLRLAANRRIPQLQIFNQTTASALYPVGTQSGNLIDLIMKAYNQNNNFDTMHTYNIVLTFTGDDSSGFDVSISINGWKVYDQNDDLY